MEGLEKLKGSRKAYRSHLTRIYGKLDELNLARPVTEETTTLVISYVDQLQRKAESLQQLDTKIQSVIEGPDDLERDVFDSIEIQDALIERMTRLKRYLEKSNTTVTTPPTSHAEDDSHRPRDTSARSAPASRLPKLDLPRFSGDPLRWQTFWDSFKAAVHSNSNLTGVEKFNYLRAQLDGEASRTVSGFTLTDANYEQSVSLLESRFGKKQRIINAHMQALLDLPTPSNNAASLRQLYDTIESHIRGLESLGKSKETFGDFLIPIIFGKLPSVVRRNLTRDHTSEQWNIDELRSSIEKEIIILESGLEHQGEHNRSTITGSFHTSVRKGSLGLQLGDKRVVSTKPVCAYCKGPHSSTQCNVVSDVKARLDVVKRERLCFNCLGNHKAMHCNSKNRCRLCHKKHHSSLCGIDSTRGSIPTNSTLHDDMAHPREPSQMPQNLQSSQTLHSTLNPASGSFVPTQSVTNLTTATRTLTTSNSHSPLCLLKTAVSVVRVGDNRVSANILFDEGAQRSFVTETLAHQLGATPHHKENLSISSFGGEITPKNQVNSIQFVLETDGGDVNITALVVPKIAAPIQNFTSSDLHSLTYLRGLKLAHPVGVAEKFDISFLIGTDYYWDIVGNHIVRGRGPTAMQSKLGYLLSGPLQIDSPVIGMFHTYTTQMFEAELPDHPEPPSNDFSTTPVVSQQNVKQLSRSFMQAYQKNCISRDENGSYAVQFPWKEKHPPLPSNLMICERRTRALARRLGHQPKLLKLYGDIITEQEQRNFIEQIPNHNTNSVHYIPHHPVRKNSPTTPVRIVYDCSCRQSSKHASLNDCLIVSDPALADLPGILLRFRLHYYALSTDIEKAFLHVKLDEQDRDFTRFFWLSDHANPESTLTTYRFKVVLFGSASSPFMLSATLDHHLNSYNSPVSHDMKNNLYVDNIISGCESEEAILQYYTESRAIMGDANFNLRSWASNNNKLQEQAQRDHVLESDTTVNLHGLKWNTCTDTIALSQRQIKHGTATVTKRNILQASSEQYDPLGWLSPITVRAKLLIQELWKKRVSWDEPLDAVFNSKWCQVATDIEEAAKIVMTRRYSVMSTNQCVYLHVFADASMKAYGAVAYLQGAEQVDFVMAKSRVSPLKDNTLPRLELRAAVMAAHLATFIVSTLHNQLRDVVVRLWSDSQIVLYWISSNKQLKPFVANRIKEIRSLFPIAAWGYCHTTDNAADLLTRGITPAQLQTALWSHGPVWLTSENDWPKWSPTSVLHIRTSEDVEPTASMVTTSIDSTPGLHQIIDINRYSKLTRLLRVTACVLHFVNNIKRTSQKLTSSLTATELSHAQKLWIKSAQQTSFSTEIINLQSKSSPCLPLVRQLRLYLNSEGIICCGGRIHNAPVSRSTKFPYLLPRKHKLTEIIVCDIHEKQFHAGTNSTVTYLRQKY